MDGQKPLDMDDFNEQVGANRIRMASAYSLAEKMQLPRQGRFLHLVY